MTKVELGREVERLRAQVEILLALVRERGVRVEYVPYYPWYRPYCPPSTWEPIWFGGRTEITTGGQVSGMGLLVLGDSTSTTTGVDSDEVQWSFSPWEG